MLLIRDLIMTDETFFNPNQNTTTCSKHPNVVMVPHGLDGQYWCSECARERSLLIIDAQNQLTLFQWCLVLIAPITVLMFVFANPFLSVGPQGEKNTNALKDRLEKIELKINAIQKPVQEAQKQIDKFREKPVTADPQTFLKIRSIAAGPTHFLILTEGGEVKSWGQTEAAIVPSNLKRVVAIAAGDAHSVALKDDNSVTVWGDDQNNENPKCDYVPIPKDLKNITKIAAGGRHTLALTKDGNVVGWGDNCSGEAKVPIELLTNKDPVIQIAAGKKFSLALTKSGAVKSWGNWGHKENAPQVPNEARTQVIAIAAGDKHALALLKDGTPIEWTTTGVSNVPNGLTEITRISADRNFSWAFNKSGLVAAWGGIETDENYPKWLNPKKGIQAVVSTKNATLAIKTDGDAFGWNRSNNKNKNQNPFALAWIADKRISEPLTKNEKEKTKLFKEIAESEKKTDYFWFWQIFPTCFFASLMAIIVGRWAINFLYRVILRRRAVSLVGWFHPTHLIRDAALIAIVVSTFPALIITVGRGVSLLTSARELETWIITRAPIYFAISSIAFWLFGLVGQINRNALFPNTSFRYVWSIWYALLLVALYKVVQIPVIPLSQTRIGYIPLLLSAAIFLIFWIIHQIKINDFRQKIKLVKDQLGAQTSIPATIALVGPSKAGKTVFLTRSYSLMQTVGSGLVTLGQTVESSATMGRLSNMLKNREWPPGTVEAHEIPFQLNHKGIELIKFHWLDVPGGIFTNPNSRNQDAALVRFKNQLGNCDALIMLIDALDLAKVNQDDFIPYQDIYQDQAQELFQKHKQLGNAARAIPLAIIITKACMVSKSQYPRMRRQVQTFAIQWKEIASANGLKAAPVKVFFTSAIITAENQDNSRPPVELKSENCIEPMIWVTSQIMRTHIGALDVLTGFNHRSELQTSILRLEALA
jgi:alpha-tubulin suppressor-like RCC1 family protein